MIEYEWMNDSLHYRDDKIGKFVGTVQKMPDRDYWIGWLWDGEPSSEYCGRFPSREQAQMRVLAAAKAKHAAS